MMTVFLCPLLVFSLLTQDLASVVLFPSRTKRRVFFPFRATSSLPLSSFFFFYQLSPFSEFSFSFELFSENDSDALAETSRICPPEFLANSIHSNLSLSFL